MSLGFDDLEFTDADMGKGVCVVNNWSYDGCALSGRYSCFSRKDWHTAFVIARELNTNEVFLPQDVVNQMTDLCYNGVCKITGFYTVK